MGEWWATTLRDLSDPTVVLSGAPTRPCRVLHQRIKQKRLDYSVRAAPKSGDSTAIPRRLVALTDSGIPCLREPNGLPGAEQRTRAFPPGDTKASVLLGEKICNKSTKQRPT